MIERIHDVKGAEYIKVMKQMQISSNRTNYQLRVSFYVQRIERYLYLDSSLIDPIDESQKEELVAALGGMVKSAQDNGLKRNLEQQMRDLVLEHIENFGASLYN